MGTIRKNCEFGYIWVYGVKTIHCFDTIYPKKIKKNILGTETLISIAENLFTLLINYFYENRLIKHVYYII